MSKRQGAVATSTYSAEFCAMRTAAEEAISIRYTLRSLGVPVVESTKIFPGCGIAEEACGYCFPSCSGMCYSQDHRTIPH